MLTLSLDTSGDICSAALFDGSRELSALNFRHDRTLLERLPEILNFLLRDRRLTMGDIEAFAVGLGPGSFTGVRVGVTLAKTFAFASGRPLVGVSSLDALAETVPALPNLYVAAVAPTRRTESVVAFFVAGQHTPVEPPAVIANDRIVGEAHRLFEFGPETSLLLLGEPAESIRQVIDPDLYPNIIFQTQSVTASAVGRIAAARLARGESDPVDAFTPLYVTPTPVSAF